MKPCAAFFFLAAAVLASGCTQTTDPIGVAALSQSGQSTFVCLGRSEVSDGSGGAGGSAGLGGAGGSGDAGSSAEDVHGLPLSRCSSAAVESLDDFSVPHLYALVTQTRLGEVAVIDLTTRSILDEDPGTPGANFLPVGAQPVDIVASPGGTSAFVAIAEVGHEGIFALPTKQIRPCPGCMPPKLSSWPGCSLPSAPGEIVVVSDPVDRYACSAGAGVPEPTPTDRPAHLDLGIEKLGRQKLLVTLPERGSFVVIDAQQLLDGHAKSVNPGDPVTVPPTFDACKIEKEVKLLSADPTPPPMPPLTPHGLECVDPAVPVPAALSAATSRPAGLALADGRLFIADLVAPLVHVVNVADPCDPKELPSLLPTSVEEPERVVTTTRLAVSAPATPELRRFLYAVDGGDGSMMVFDVSDGAVGRAPISRPHPEWNPFQAPDRIRYNAPVRDIAIVHRDIPATLSATGVAPEGIRCDPDPALKCDDQNASCDIPALYRTSAAYDSGAGPLKLRGTFAFAVLTNGRVTLVDIDDFDADCRGPKQATKLAGCATSTPAGTELATSNEASCNVVMPNSPRAASFVASNATTGVREPGVLLYPILYDASGAALPVSNQSLKMRATFPREGDAPLFLAVGADREQILTGTPATQGLLFSSDELRHALLMNLEDPRAQAFDQNWIVTYEGVLPSFGGRYAEFHAEEGLLVDADSRFCDGGVQSEGSLDDANLDGPADFVQITSELADETNSYWNVSSSGSSGTACSFTQCNQAYGGFVTSRPQFTVKEAYQDHLELTGAPADLELARCCFPGKVQFTVRAGGQWVVRGETSSFLHHVIADPATGKCRDSCDPNLARLNGRVRSAPADASLKDGDAFTFINPMFRFVITQGSPPPAVGGLPERDMQFRFTTQGSFVPLTIVLSTSAEIQPQAIRSIPPTGELMITDGSLQGVVLLAGNSFGIARSFY